MKKTVFLLIAFLFCSAEGCPSKLALPLLLDYEILSTSDGDKILESSDSSASIRLIGRGFSQNALISSSCGTWTTVSLSADSWVIQGSGGFSNPCSFSLTTRDPYGDSPDVAGNTLYLPVE